MKKHILAASVAALSLLATSCGDSNQWTVKGSIDGAAGKDIVLETSTFGRWMPMDTATIDDNGNFEMKNKAAGYPDIYRLSLDGKKLYFPIDSIETVEVRSTASAFDRDYTLAGSAAAEALMEVDRKVMEVVKAKGEAAIATDSVLKREVTNILLTDPDGSVAYYIINKKVGNTPLFSANSKSDLRVIGAVANAFTQNRPKDPRTLYLKSLYLVNRPAAPRAGNDTITVNEAQVIDINLYDNTGKAHSLAELAKQGKVIVLNFTVYSAEQSPAFNLELAKIYEKRKAAGLEIYQVAIDEDEFQWKQSAKNLPWITVYNSPVTGAANLMSYNITTLPAIFIINRKGEIVERVENIADLDARLKKYM